MRSFYDVIVIGGGPAGMAAALAAREHGAAHVLIAERDDDLGGILNQCIHSGFGLQYFGEELTGPEYAARFIDRLPGADIDVALGTTVLDISSNLAVHTISSSDGPRVLHAGAIVLAMGCRERPRGAIGIPGSRPAGVLTAGTAQRLINIDGWAVGKRVAVLGSGDIGLIMARRLTLEGAEVLGCFEVMPYSSGLARNIAQCLDDFGIPLHLSHTIVDIEGSGRVERITAAKVDAGRRPIPGTEFSLACDTVLLSVGLIPENELSRQAGADIDVRTNGPVVDERMETSVPGIYACGNVVHVHDLVDNVTAESERAGACAAQFAAEQRSRQAAELRCGSGISYTVPQLIRSSNAEAGILFRVNRVVRRGDIVLRRNGEEIGRFPKRYLAPGEMQKVVIKSEMLKNTSDGPIWITLEEAQAAP